MKQKNKEKERQNKNRISSLILTLVILSFLFLIFFVLILSLIGFLPKEGLINFNEEIQNVFRITRDKFTIYKDECVNETILIDYTYTEFCLYGIDRNITPICPRMNDKIVFLEPITLGVSEQLRLGKKAITKEICEEKKEVDKSIRNCKLQIKEGKLTGSKSKFYKDMGIKLEELKQKLKGASNETKQ